MVDDIYSLRCWLEGKCWEAHLATCTPELSPEEIIKARGQLEAYGQIIRYIETRNRNQRPHFNYAEEYQGA